MLYVSVIIHTYNNIQKNGRLFALTDKNGRIEGD
jgi:hypothetical protein